MAQPQGSQQQEPQGLQIQFEVSLVPAQEGQDVAGFTAQGFTPVRFPNGGLAQVNLGGRDFNLVLGKTYIVGGNLGRQL